LESKWKKIEIVLKIVQAQVAQRGGGVSFSGDIQGPVQPAVGDPASAGGLDLMIHRGPFQPLTFCDNTLCVLEYFK